MPGSSCAGLTQLQGHFKMLWSPCSFWLLGVVSILLGLLVGAWARRSAAAHGICDKWGQEEEASFAFLSFSSLQELKLRPSKGPDPVWRQCRATPLGLCTLAQAERFPRLMREL